MLDPSYCGSPTANRSLPGVAKKSESEETKKKFFCDQPDRRVQTASTEGPRGSQAGVELMLQLTHTLH
jgi:hypothetical protein